MNALVISAHPDDETLGCGGTLLKHSAGGDQLFWIIGTQGQEPDWSREVLECKSAEVEEVAQAFGMEQYIKLGFPANGLGSVPASDLIQKLQKAISKLSPEVVYLVHQGDAHTDHQVIFAATMAVLKPFYMARLGVRRVLSYETLSSTEAAPPQREGNFVPNVFSDISPFIDRKVEIMDLYQSEIQQDPMPRTASAIRALARYRGATIGVEHAEAFMLIRELY